MSHANARLTVHGRLLLVQRVASGRPAAHVARELGISRQCAYRWVRRYAAGGLAGLADRSSRPRRMPRRTAPAVEARVVAARRGLRRGPAFIAQATGVPRSKSSHCCRKGAGTHTAQTASAPSSPATMPDSSFAFPARLPFIFQFPTTSLERISTSRLNNPLL